MASADVPVVADGCTEDCSLQGQHFTGTVPLETCGVFSLGSNVWRPGGLLATETPQGTRHHHLDHLGTPRIVTDTNGTTLRYPPPAVTSSRCRWELTQGGAQQQLWLELVDPPSQHVHYHFTETSAGELVIWQYIGDPDAWRYLEYSKA